MNAISSASLSVLGLDRTVSERSLLQDISFSLRPGECLGIIGPSGAGKTTLLRCIALLDRIAKGSLVYTSVGPSAEGATEDRITIEAADFDRAEFGATVQRLRRQIGFVFQGLNLWANRSVLSNITLAPRVVRHWSRAQARARALELCEEFGIERLRDARVWNLSGGERQRVAIIRALIMEPAIVLLDEITSALDPLLVVDVMRAIERLKERKLALVVVTHHLEFAAKLCDRFVFLSKGRVVQIGNPREVMGTPATEEVRAFLSVLRTAR
jgi:ABC-type polar amino acid transport system ATPase subunit